MEWEKFVEYFAKLHFTRFQMEERGEKPSEEFINGYDAAFKHFKENVEEYRFDGEVFQFKPKISKNKLRRMRK